MKDGELLVGGDKIIETSVKNAGIDPDSLIRVISKLVDCSSLLAGMRQSTPGIREIEDAEDLVDKAIGNLRSFKRR